ncbi:MAG: DEAD/DEAH box helicase [Magnetococcus sp. WYHC-3]
MKVLHAAFCGGHLLLWGETSISRDDPASGKSRGGKSRLLQPSPYDLGFNGLNDALEAAGMEFRADKDWTGGVEAWLPSQGSAPWPSTPLIGAPPASSTQVHWLPWNITAFAMLGREAVALLCACVGKDTLAPGVLVGSDLAFWAQALRFAGSMVARQRFIPGLAKEGKTWCGRWIPCFNEQDAVRLEIFARAMPSSARALTLDNGIPPESPPRAIVRQFLEWILDHLVRSATGLQGLSPAHPRHGKGHRFPSVHDAWLHGLLSSDDEVEGKEADLVRLQEDVRRWHLLVSVSDHAPFRLCFRLEEPAESDGPWTVRYLLRSVEDPSLLIPVEKAWKNRSAEAAMFREMGFNVQEYLLSSLGQAAKLSVEMERGLRASKPSHHTLDGNGAYRFLTETAFILEESGFGILLPSWWTRTGTKQRLRLHANVESPKFQTCCGSILDTLVHFEWQVAIGEESLTYGELQTLAQMKSDLIQVRGQWVHVDAQELQAALEFWKKRKDGSARVRDIVRMAIGAEEVSDRIPLSGVTATGWIGDLLNRLSGRMELAPLPLPAGFLATLRPYQERGFAWLDFLVNLGFGACLADDMGLGKTVQALALVARRREGLSSGPALLVCPTSVIGNWLKEAAKFAPQLSVLVHHGADRDKGTGFAEAALRHDMVLTSYALLYRDLHTLQNIAWAGVILDEAQNIKNAETRQARAVRSLESGYRITLTGTPVENNVGDLWSLMEFLNPGFLGHRSGFKNRFFVPIQAHRDAEAAQRLKSITGPFILRRLKTDASIITDLPEKMEMKVYCNLTREQASLYETVVEALSRDLENADSTERRGILLGALSKLKQVCNHPAHFLGDHSALANRSGKLARLAEMLEEVLAAGERALIFTQFAEMGTLLQGHLQETFGQEALFLHGGVAKKKRDEMVERFQSHGGPSLFILSLKAGGTGLNLTRANHVFHFDRWWNPAVENQATDRAFRIGQDKNVQVHKFLCVGTLEEKIDEMIERKKDVADEVVGTGEAWLTELSTDALKEIFALRHEALGTI